MYPRYEQIPVCYYALILCRTDCLNKKFIKLLRGNPFEYIREIEFIYTGIGEPDKILFAVCCDNFNSVKSAKDYFIIITLKVRREIILHIITQQNVAQKVIFCDGQFCYCSFYFTGKVITK